MSLRWGRSWSVLIIAMIASTATVPDMAARASSNSAEGRVGEVQASEAQRFAAMVRVDARTLDRLLAADLTYVRPTGRLETKAEFIAAIISGESHYLTIESLERQVRIYGDSALINGLAKTSARTVGNEVAMPNVLRYTSAYAWRDSRWQLVAWHATRLPQDR